MKHKNTVAYPYLAVVAMFAGLGSLIGGLIVQLVLLWIFREANFAQIGYQPLLYVGLLGLLPALLTGVIVASKRIWQEDIHSIRHTFLIGFVISALYMALIISYLGITSLDEFSLLVIATLAIGLFGGVNSAIASVFALPKTCITGFDKVSKKDQDNYNAIQQID